MPSGCQRQFSKPFNVARRTMFHPRSANGEELFLNNELLKCGHARRYDKVRLADWEE
jgi:hypothetical protein